MNEKTAISGGSSFSSCKAHLPFRGTNHRSFEARLAGLDVVKRVELFQQNHFPHFSKVLRRPIYEVSTLLGHSSVTTTERHYAPLLTTEIDDFVL